MRSHRHRAELQILVWSVVLLAAACSSVDATDQAGTGDSSPALTVARPTVLLNGAEAAAGNPIDVDPGDTVVVEGGLGLVEYSNVLELEMFISTNVVLPDPDDLIVRLKSGHLHVTLDQDVEGSLVVDLGERTLTTTEPGTEFVVCQAPEGATCVYVVEGGLQWEGDGDPALYGAGEGTFARPGEPPESPNCPPAASFSRWMSGSRNGTSRQSLSDYVGQWAQQPCDETSEPVDTGTTTTVAAGLEPQPTDPAATTTTMPDTAAAEPPSGVGMAHVVIAAPSIGTDVDSDSPHYIAPRNLEGPIEFYVDMTATTNADFRRWLASFAGDDPALWIEYAPDGWLDKAPGGAATQATYPEGSGDEAVRGVRWQAAANYCESQSKRLPTEIEWELAAVGDHLVDRAAAPQDWVAEPEAYGELPEGDRVLRGTDPALDVDLYYRLYLEDRPEATVARANAGVRCAADEVAEGTAEPAAGGDVVYSDDFVDESAAWPKSDTEGFTVGYHGPDDYHVESSEPHQSVIVLRGGVFDEVIIETEVSVLKTEGVGNFRYGLAVGSRDQGLLLLTVQPSAGGNELDWCVQMVSEALANTLRASGDAFASFAPGDTVVGHEGEVCSGLAGGTAAVTAEDNTLRVELFPAGATVLLDGAVLESVDVPIAVEEYGFFVQTYHMDRAHIHYGSITVVTP